MDNDSTSHPLPPTTPAPSGSGVFPPNEAIPRSTGPGRILAFLVGLPLGFLVHFGSLLVLGIGIRFGINPRTGITAAVVLCVISIAAAIPLLRRPPFHGFAFGILIGVALTALLTAQCAMSLPIA